MNMKPWREVARPHSDVLEGEFSQAEFAADIARVANGKAEKEYQETIPFFARTYITEGMRDLLLSVVRRLSKQGGDPVIQLQTNFGGGKTHTLLAVYHMARQQVPLSDMAGVEDMLRKAGVQDPPKARVAVIDGISMTPNQPMKREGLEIATLWGWLAYELLGEEGYAMVRESDISGTAPGKEVLIALLEKAAPCVVLMDELVAFLRQLSNNKQLAAGTLAANMTFIQALTESMKAVPTAILLASLPESNTEAVDVEGQQTLTILEKYFGRLETVWRPVGAEESFEIVRRRLFDTTGAEADVEQTCDEYARYYRKNKESFPEEVNLDQYKEKLRRSYPIHPEVFDRLYGDWATLDKFQKTRGVLQYMALVIHRLWVDNDQDPMIMPGSLPLYDGKVCDKATPYLPGQGWDNIISTELDGPNSASAEIDGKDQRFGAVQAAHRVSRTVFLGSAHSNRKQGARGLHIQRVLLGCARPGDTLAVYEDVCGHMRDRMHYLFTEKDRYWFDTHPNLLKEMESRKRNIDPDATLEKVMKQELGRSYFFGGVHVFVSSTDIPDDLQPNEGPRLVLLPLKLERAFSKENPRGAFDEARRILGAPEEPGALIEERQRYYKNRVLFLAPDAASVGRVQDSAKTYLAWKEINDEIEAGQMTVDTNDARQVRNNVEQTKKSLGSILQRCYNHLIVPYSDDPRKIQLRERAVDLNGGRLMKCVEDVLHNNEDVIERYSPSLMKKEVLDSRYFNNGRTEVSLKQLWRDMSSYCYFPRLHTIRVLEETIQNGVEQKCYGYATGKEGDEYIGFVYGERVPALFTDDEAVIISKETAAAYAEKLAAAQPQNPGTEDSPTPAPGSGTTPDETAPRHPGAAPAPQNTPAVRKRRFGGDINLDGCTAGPDFMQIMEDVVSHLMRQPGADVKIHVDIEAHAGLQPFDDNTVRIVKENTATLHFNLADFYES